MTTRYKARAFVFKKNDRNESDRIFSVFTNEFGRLDIFAKAIRKEASKLRSGIDIFSISDIEFIQGKNRKTLTDAIIIEKFNNIYDNLDRLKVANKMSEVLDNFINGEERDEEMFSLLSDSIQMLNNYSSAIKSCSIIFYYFLWNALSLLGYRPEIQKCIICQQQLKQSNIYFSDKLGGIICDKCLWHDKNAHKINSDIVKILRLIFKKDLQILYKLKVELSSRKLFKKISDNYYVYTLSGHSFKNISKVNI